MTASDFWLRLRALVLPHRVERELHEELTFHVEMQVRKHLAAGLDFAEARRLALAEFGSTALIEDQVRDTRGVRFFEGAMRDVRHAGRSLRRSPSFTICAVLTLALGIGATTAMFTLTDAVLFRPLPVPAPERLLRIETTEAADAARQGRPTPGAVVDAIRAAHVFAGVCGFLTPLTTVDMQGRTASVSAVVTSGACFETLGIRPALGRLLAPADDLIGAAPVIVLSHDTWQQDFGGRADVLEQTIRVDGESFRIIGVVERAFPGLVVGFPARIYFPLHHVKLPPELSYASLGQEVFARLRDGDTAAGVSARLETEWPEWLAASIPSSLSGAERSRYLNRRPLIGPSGSGVDYSLRPRFGRPLMALLAIASLVLLVAAVNVANLLLARAADRRRDTAVRFALGATRRQLAQRVLLESGIVLIAATAAGVLIAYWCDRLLVGMFQATSPGFSIDVTPNVRALSFASVAASLSFLVFALGPALRSPDVDIVAFQSASTRTTGERTRTRHVVLIAQVAMTLVLVSVGSVFVDALSSLRNAPFGIDMAHVLAVQLAELPGGYVNGAGPSSYYRALVERMRAIPGVESVSLSADPPFGTVRRSTETAVANSQATVLSIEEQIITDHFFDAMNIPLIAGEDFQPVDAERGEHTVIVSESLARQLFQSQSPLGRAIRTGTRPELQRQRIVGVARDAVLSRPQAHNTLIVYQNWWQAPILDPTVVIRTRVKPTSVAGVVRTELQREGREFPRRIRTLDEVLDGSLAQERLLASLSAAFSLLGLGLAAVGLYGLLAFSVANRTNEIGVRMALGASRLGILRLVVGDALVMLGTGIGLGVPLAWLAVTTASRTLFASGAPAALPISSATALLTVIAVVAAATPALRAASVNPVDALRRD